MCWILRLFAGSFMAALLAMSFVLVSSSVCTIFRPLARSVVPVSVTSTMASTRPSTALASVAPQENSTFTGMFRSAKYRFVKPTSSVEMVFPAQSSRLLMGEEAGQARTHRALVVLALE